MDSFTGATPEIVEQRVEAFRDALADDFNTPRAIAEMFSLISDARRKPLPGAGAAIKDMLQLLGLESLAVSDDPTEVSSEAEQLLLDRNEARAAKDFARADKIRDRLAELGYEVRDEAGGVPRLVPRG